MRLVALVVVILCATKAARADKPIVNLYCGAEFALRSRASDVSLHLEFANDTDGPIFIYWLDFEGHRVHYNTLAPGESYEQQTYVTHPWVVVDAADNRCLRLLVPHKAGRHRVSVGK
jgi:von Hippel-Lindau disease tumor suppressor protein